MGALNVKNPEAHRLAVAITRTTGRTITDVVTQALRESFDRLPSQRRKASLKELRAIAKRAAALVKKPYLDHAKFLYDQDGLPK